MARSNPHSFVPYGSPHLQGSCARCGRPWGHRDHCYHLVVKLARDIFQWSGSRHYF